MEYRMAYGKKYAELILPDGIEPEIIRPSEVDGLENPAKAAKFSLFSHEYGVSIDDFHGCKTAAIAINDKTRPVPFHIILPPLLSAVMSIGIPPKNISLIAATGTHLPMDDEEIRGFLPADLPREIQVYSHDCDDADNLVFLGTTSRNTPVYANRKFYDADLRIVTGTIEPHHFAGFSGGVKSASIGLGGRETINHNHKLLSETYSCLGEYEKNPLRQDIEEIGRLMKVYFAVNVIMNEKREIVHVLSGSPGQVMKRGVLLSRSICETPVKGKFDLVIASAGGYPKDINLYQSQKALTNASLLTRDGGAVILVTACEEGVGSRGYEEFMQGIKTWQEVYKKFEREEFRVGPHKAFQFARELSRIRVHLMSELPDEQVKSLLLEPVEDLSGLVYGFIKASPTPISIAILPKATNTIPGYPKALQR